MCASPSNCTSTLVSQSPTMESLLSMSFDYLSCSDASKIRKGLKQLEGLLAQLCLCRSANQTTADKRRSMINPGSAAQTPKELGALKDDPAFREFFKLQEGFECNGTDHGNGDWAS